MRRALLAIALMAQAVTASGATLYVWQSSPSSAPPFATWANAARNIQDAIDSATTGDDIVVTNGVYATGGRIVGAYDLTNRVAVTKAVSVRSVNGPAVTHIRGQQVPDARVGGAAVRCVYLTNGTALIGFTLTNGATRSFENENLREDSGGGIWCESASALVSNCVLVGNAAFATGGGAYGGTLQACRLADNSAADGGGAYGSSLINCALTGNSASSGGGAEESVLNGCTLSGNAANFSGGGAAYCTLVDCVVSTNSAAGGGGAYDCFLDHCTLERNTAFHTNGGNGGGAREGYLTNCTLTANAANGDGGGAAGARLEQCQLFGNAATAAGGGAAGGSLYNCLLTGNSSASGGGAIQSGLINCTLVGNSATIGGGAHGAYMINCIAYFNSAPTSPNYFSGSGTINYSCTAPLPTTGTGNITNEPAFVDAAAGNYRLRHGSPCIDSGDGAPPPGGTDIDGRPRPLDGNGDGLAAFDMGAYENKLPLLVWQGSPNPVPPFQTWATAAHTIQDAIDAAEAGDEITVSNGVYATGESGGARVLIAYEPGDGTDPIVVRSVNGPAVTVIDGSQAMRCAVVPDGILSGFTLRNGRGPNGAGAIGGVLTNCIIINNHAVGDDPVGGGVDQAVLLNCQLIDNVSDDEGGGAANSVLVNCSVAGNQASVGGGVSVCTLYNSLVISNHGAGATACALVYCTVVGNSGGGLSGGFDACAATNCIVYHNAGANFGDSSLGQINFTCTFPLPTNGVGNITNAPLFVNAATGDYRLRMDSPCIDVGTNLSAPVSSDFDGLRRPLGGNRDGIAAFDLGAYEFNPLFFTSITKVGNNARLCWFDTLAGMQLQAASSLANPVWTNVPFAPGTNSIELPLGGSPAFYRLVTP